MEAARFNIYWFLWLLAPAITMLIATYKPNKVKIISLIMLSLVLTYSFSNLAVIRKWDIRMEIAKTKEELEHATADGANKVFTLMFIAPIEAIFFTSLWGGVGYYVHRRKEKST
jgi:hypothetical protein